MFNNILTKMGNYKPSTYISYLIINRFALMQKVAINYVNTQWTIKSTEKSFSVPCVHEIQSKFYEIIEDIPALIHNLLDLQFGVGKDAHFTSCVTEIWCITYH